MKPNWKGHFINGEWLRGSGTPFRSDNPASGDGLWCGNNATAEDIHAAVAAAVGSFGQWSSLSLAERSEYLSRFVDVLKENREELAARISREIGKPQWESKTEVGAMIGKLDPTLEAYRERNSNSSRELGNGICHTRYRPHGVVCVLGPYNFPGHMPNGHIMPALLAGNTIVFKPSEFAPFSSELIVELWQKAGLPKGVLNLVQGDGDIGGLLCRNKDVRGVFFTGSYQAGETIRSTVEADKLCALEMGGNSPLIVWDTSHLDSAVFAAVQSAFVTSGQRCSAARRLIIPNNAFGKEFLDRLVEVTENILVGAASDVPEPFMGPLRHSGMAEKVMLHQDMLIAQGAEVLKKCKRREGSNCMVSPGILDVTGLDGNLDEEVVGPLLKVYRVETFEDALNAANDSQYGLAAGIFTEDEGLYDHFRNEIQAGIINWNQQLTGASGWAPFGGIKSSGNFHPSAYLAADYCVYATASIENPKVILPKKLPPGVNL